MWGIILLWLWYEFPWWIVRLSIFSYTFWLFVYFLWRNSYPSLFSLFHFSNTMTLTCRAFIVLNPRDGGAWWAAFYGVTQSQTQLKRLSSSSSRWHTSFSSVSYSRSDAMSYEPLWFQSLTQFPTQNNWLIKIYWMNE